MNKEGPDVCRQAIVSNYSITPMVVPVNYFDPPHHHLRRTNWHVLGQLKLATVSTSDGTISAWLIKALSDLHLPGDLISRLLASMEEVMARVLSSDIKERQFEHLEIVVLVPVDQASKGHTWGFFRVEKASADSQSESTKGRYLEYYLYLDKKKGEQEPIIC